MFAIQGQRHELIVLCKKKKKKERKSVYLHKFSQVNFD